MRTFKVTLAYDGTEFAGWQLQAGPRTVQGVLEAALEPFDNRRIVVHAAGRTDAGVHASGQVVSFSLESEITPDALLRALNVRLPDDVRAMRVEEAPLDFNARFHAQRKTYHYAIHTGAVVPPQIRHFVWHIPQPLAIDAMNAAAAQLLGEHDFAGFQAAGGDVLGTRRQIVRSLVSQRDNQVVYEVTGSGFLRHMVRNIVGTLVDIGRGRRPVADMARVLASRDRAIASATAPPHGLTLWCVDY
jgi:tRNA pseudouridine38-40 synthase